MTRAVISYVISLMDLSFRKFSALGMEVPLRHELAQPRELPRNVMLSPTLVVVK